MLDKTFDIRKLRGGIGIRRTLAEIGKLAQTDPRSQTKALCDIMLALGEQVRALTTKSMQHDLALEEIAGQRKPKRFYVQELKSRGLTFDVKGTVGELKELYDAVILAEQLEAAKRVKEATPESEEEEEPGETS